MPSSPSPPAERSRSSADAPLPLLRSATLGPRLALGLMGIYLLLLIGGVVVFQLPKATIRGNELSLERAVFTVVNAATLTGFQQHIPIEDLGPTGRACIIILTIAGTLITLLVGGLGVARATRMPYTDGQVIRVTLFTYVFLVGCGSALLLEPGRGLLASFVQAASAFGNSGIVLGRLPLAIEWRTHAVLLPLALLAGLSIPVLMEAGDAIFTRRRLTTHSRVVLSLTAFVYLAGLAMLIPWQSMGGAADPTPGIVAASALSIDARTAGFPMTTIGGMTRIAQWLLIVLMLIGAAPGGAGGGLKVTALFHFVRGTRRALRREPGLRITGIAATWMATYLILVLATLLALLATLPEMAADRLVFLAVSAVGTVGLSHDPVAVQGSANYVLAAAMLMGRITPLMVLWWCAQTCDDADVAV